TITLSLGLRDPCERSLQHCHSFDIPMHHTSTGVANPAPLLCSNLRSSEMESAMRGSKTILWSVWIILTISLIACGGRRRTGDVIDDTDTSGDLNNDVDLGELPDGAECFEGTSQCSM